MKLNFDYLERCNLTLERSLESLVKTTKGTIDYEVSRNAVVKSFELTLETVGKILRKILKFYMASPKEVDALVYKDVLRHAALRGLMTNEELERWLQYRDNRNSTAHDYGEEFAENTLELIIDFQKDVTKLHQQLVKKYEQK